MITLKQTRDSLYRMLSRNVVKLQEVPRTADHSPAKTFYLWSVVEHEIVQVFLDEIYQVMLKLRQRISKIYDDSEALFNRSTEEQRLRLDGDASASLLSETEAQQVQLQQAIIDQLDISVTKLDETLMVLTEF